MTLAPGTRLGTYEVVAAIGAGGMGEVFRARDAALNRDVAIKVLPAALAADAERLARFKREAQLLASLSHSNIAHVYGFEAATLPDGSTAHFLAMELVEGEDLAERLKRGPIPVDEAIAIAKQIAEGLEEAHERGIIHRDLKPANIKVTPDGKVKILDFGLAKAIEGDHATSASNSQISHSPTLSRQMTEAGVIMGTAAYMSPEQARGKSIDKRTDIWAFGVVLFEMLTGTRLFTGETVSDVLAGVLKTEIDFKALPAHTPTSVRRLLRRCLFRDPGDRLRDIADARADLSESAEIPEAPGQAFRGVPRRSVFLALGWPAAAVCLLAALWLVLRPPSPPPVRHLAVDLEDGLVLGPPTDEVPVAISADGSTLALILTHEAKGSEAAAPASLFIKRLDEPGLLPVPDTAGATLPFFSPDGKWIAFFRARSLWKMPLSGGAPVAVCAVDGPYGGTWMSDDTIILTPSASSGLFRVPAAGGTPTRLTTVDSAAGEQEHDFPFWIPGTRKVLITVWKGGSWADSDIAVLDLDSGRRQVVVNKGSHAGYAFGFVVYGRLGKLYAVPFNPSTGLTTGTPVEAYDGVLTRSVAAPYFALSPAGTLAAFRGEVETRTADPVWMNAGGSVTRIGRQSFNNIDNLAPDGQRAVYTTFPDSKANGSFDIRIYDLQRDTSYPVSTDPAWDFDPSWSPDGKSILFSSSRSGIVTLFVASALGEGPARELLPPGRANRRNGVFSPDGKNVLFVEASTETARDIWMVPLEGDRAPTPLVATKADESEPHISPDGRRLSYLSDVSGRREVWVEPFPTTGERWQVSDGGAGYETWTPDGRLLYQTSFKSDAEVRVLKFSPPPGAPIVLSEQRLRLPPDVSVLTQVHDGRFFGLRAEPRKTWRRLGLVLNWQTELRRLFP